MVLASVSWKYVGRWLARYFTQVINLGFETQIFRTWVNYLGELPNEVTIQVLNPGYIPGEVTIQVLNPDCSPRFRIPGFQNQGNQPR